ncbi:hypothetical protein Barb7_01624 [Bacteroidales bacterium Barb7]|nr:hypothetical protein Barb7_01624 [Bacteroidales bacterium Barb7]
MMTRSLVTVKEAVSETSETLYIPLVSRIVSASSIDKAFCNVLKASSHELPVLPSSPFTAT